jgi:hypothetical protein
MSSHVEHPNLPDGSTNPNYVDLLDEDAPIAGQKFVLLSFVSPEKILKQKDHFLFEQFLKTFDLRASLEKFTDFLAFVSYKHGLDLAALNADFQEYATEEKHAFAKMDVTDSYKTFIEQHEEKLNAQFDKAHSFQTSVRSLKVRGSFSTQEEAELKAVAIRRKDPSHNIHCGVVGGWMPWDPEAYKTGRVEYMEGLQNRLMHEKQKSEVSAKEHFDERVLESKQAAIQENKERAAKTGAVLTQDIDALGNLISVGPAAAGGLSTLQETANFAAGEVSSASIQHEVFGANTVISHLK